VVAIVQDGDAPARAQVDALSLDRGVQCRDGVCANGQQRIDRDEARRRAFEALEELDRSSMDQAEPRLLGERI